MIQVTFPVTGDRIPEETTRIRAAIDGLDQEREALLGMLRAIQKMCKHKHAASGHNERDGSWATPCIFCGYCY